MTEPITIEPVIQKGLGDCGVACLAMLLGVPYANVMVAIPRRYHKDLHTGVGLSRRQLCNAAKWLGHTLVLMKDADLSECVGVLFLFRPSDPKKPRGRQEGHYAMLLRGVVFNPADGLLWTDVAAFLLTNRWDVEGVLVRKE